MHLKNFSLISRNHKVELAPAYDFLNSTIAIGAAREELALPLNGKKNHIQRKDLIDYFAYERLDLNEVTVTETLNIIKTNIPAMFNLIDISFLSDEMKIAYKDVMNQRMAVLFGRSSVASSR